MTDTDKKDCGCGCCPQTAAAYLIPQKIEAHAPLPMYKGDPFTYEDFTPEQIEDLQKPATEAAAEAQVLMSGFSKAEVIRERYEQSRVSAENERVAREELRQTAETARQANETAREAAEAKRAEVEDARRTAETERAAEFATWEAELDNKAEESELSNIIGVPGEGKIEDIDPTLVTEALRKVPQALTPKEQAQVKVNLNISKMELFCDLFSAAAGNAGYARMVNGVFDGMLNGLPVTYEEAVDIHEAGECQETTVSRYRSNNRIRTTYPIRLDRSSNVCDLGGMFQGCSRLEVVNILKIGLGQISKLRYTFDSVKLHTIGTLVINDSFSSDTIGAFNCPNLVNLSMFIAGNIVRKITLDLSRSPKISLESFQYFVNKSASQSNTFTLKVHPDVYAKLTDETNTEWHQVLIDAAAKNITFATV